MKRLCSIALGLAILMVCAAPRAEVQTAAGSGSWTDAIVLIESNAIQYTHYQPWSSTSGTVRKNGIVIVGERILTTAEWLQNATLVRVQKAGRGQWWPATIDWLDYHANLAVLSVEAADFWSGLPAARLAESVPVDGPVEIWRYLDSHLESWSGNVRNVDVRSSQRSFVRHMMLEITSDIDSSGWSEIIARGDRVLGLSSAGDGDRVVAIPATLIRSMLEAKRRDPLITLSYFPFRWQGTENPATTAYLGLSGMPRGIVVTDVPETSQFAGALKPRDIILSIDGFVIESDGDYLDPDYGYLSFYNLSTRERLAGDESVFEVWRDAAIQEITVRLAPARYRDDLLPDQSFDQAPEYAVAGGLVLQPLGTDYLRSWGDDWWKSSPFRLRFYTYQGPTPERRHLVVLSQVLPDVFNLGYQEYAFMIVDQINGQRIEVLRDVEAALQSPQEGFHVFEFLSGHGVRKLVLDAGELDAATQRVVRKYGLPAASVIH